MSKAAQSVCERTWELEAARDGRLQPKDLSSLERHVAHCAACKGEQQRSLQLSESLRNLPSLPEDLLAARRLRQRLLADANRWMMEQAPARRRALTAGRVGFAVALIALVVAGAYARHRRSTRLALPTTVPSVMTVASRSVPVEVTAESGTLWQKRQLGDELRIELDAGRLIARIGAHDPRQIVRIQLPDGWIEDLGTVLSVRVEGRHTQELHVIEGRVRLRLDGHEPLDLGVGEAWTAPAAAVVQPATVSVPAAGGSHARHAAAVAEPATTATAGPPSSVETSAAQDARAARDEDEAYLHILALMGAHRADEARAAAKDYLLKFPSGFRREEVLGVATRQP